MDYPSLKLPALRALEALTVPTLLECIDYLCTLYTPPVRGSRIRRRILHFPHDLQATLALPLAPSLELDSMEDLRADTFERAYTMRWLTYLLNNAERLPENSDILISRAATLLANCGGTAGAGVVQRIFAFPSAHGKINIALRDIPLANDDFASVGAQTWGGACVLAELIATDPAAFGIVGGTGRMRALELGAGTGLVGIALANIAVGLGKKLEVVCSDFYPTALANLAANIGANFPIQAGPVRISAHFLDWAAVAQVEDVPPFDAPFSLVLGADIVYEPAHAAWIHDCVARLLARTPTAVFHLVVPLRPTHTAESRSIEDVFGARGAGPVLSILGKETIVCGVEGSTTDEEVEYAYYRVGWDFEDTSQRQPE
ncbi:hypothetical protein B0H15DRAFT_517719 [Mycena belliarum]|uniref:Uncharacterized protein n=1 Tax=Mycena belliarum TaxID=1033014 RepID=A0AAD6XHI9_9AGAR|nr:hypothetical protein B0H15DRAFT_517719 [Mycena belliae]